MRISVAWTASELPERFDRPTAVVVLDVLRATTTITTALANGCPKVIACRSLDDARRNHAGLEGPAILAGEQNCMRPVGFALGNSPAEYTRERIAGQAVVIATTNGTVALLAAADAGASELRVAGLVNARATAQRLLSCHRLLLLCAGTNGVRGQDDVAGAGAIIDRLRQMHPAARLDSRADEASRLFDENRNQLPTLLRSCEGGRNLVASNLDADIDFAARLDAFDVSGVVVDRSAHELTIQLG